MSLIHYTRTGTGKPPLVLVHGFGCARSDWDGVVDHFKGRHETVAVDLGAHGTTPGTPSHARIETHGEDVATLLHKLDLPPAVVFGHSMGCRIALEAAHRVPAKVKAVVLVDGSRLGAAGSTAHLDRAKALEKAGYKAFIGGAFEQMFHPSFDKAKAQPIIDRALARDPAIAGPLFADIGRYDAENMDRMLSGLAVPLLAIQTTFSNAQGQRQSMTKGQTSPYLDDIRSKVKTQTIEIMPETGHFPQLERIAETNAIIERFLKGLPA